MKLGVQNKQCTAPTDIRWGGKQLCGWHIIWEWVVLRRKGKRSSGWRICYLLALSLLSPPPPSLSISLSMHPLAEESTLRKRPLCEPKYSERKAKHKLSNSAFKMHWLSDRAWSGTNSSNGLNWWPLLNNWSDIVRGGSPDLSYITLQCSLFSMSRLCTGFGPGKPAYVSEPIKVHDFVLFQEYCLRESQNINCDRSASILSHDVSEIDNNVFLNSRLYGGCSILWNSSLKYIVSPVIMNSKSICAV